VLPLAASRRWRALPKLGDKPQAFKAGTWCGRARRAEKARHGKEVIRSAAELSVECDNLRTDNYGFIAFWPWTGAAALVRLADPRDRGVRGWTHRQLSLRALPRIMAA